MIIDEGLAFNPERGVDRVVLVADETGLPAVAGICATLPADASGLAIVDVPSAEDALDFEHPAGITVRWVVREHGVKPGTLALQALREAALPDAPFHAYLVGEQALPTDGRRRVARPEVGTRHGRGARMSAGTWPPCRAHRSLRSHELRLVGRHSDRT